MNETRDLLERVGGRFAFPANALERLEHRRDRKRRNRRIAAGVAGIAVFAALVFALARATLSESSPTPAVPDESPSPSIQTEQLRPILHAGEVLDPVDENGPQGHLDAFDADTGDRRTLAQCDDPCVFIYRHALSVDERWLAYEIWTCLGALPCEPQAGIWVTNALGEHMHLTSPCDEPDRCHQEVWAWSSVGATLAVGEWGNAPGVLTIDPQTGERTPISNDRDVTALAWSPDGSQLAYAGSKIHIYDVATGRSTLLADAIGSVDTIAWSPDGSSLAVDTFADDRDRVIVLAADGSDQRTLVDQGAPQGPAAPAWSPDGSQIAYVTTPQQEGAGRRGHYSFEVWVIGADGSNAARVFAGECCIGEWSGPIWSPDGNQVAFFDDVDMPYGTWLITNADGTGEPREIDELDARSWEPDGIPPM